MVYDRLFKRLEKCLLSARICVVVGFRFRDPDINTIFRKALESNRTLTILVVSSSATSSLMNLVGNRREFNSLKEEKRIYPLKYRFGTNSARAKIYVRVYPKSVQRLFQFQRKRTQNRL